MSIIQSIRDKYARVAVIMIALSLIGFILTDYVKGKNRGGFRGGGSNTVGTVDGKKISFEDFDSKVKQQLANMKQQGYPESPGLSQQANDQVWSQEITEILLNEEFSKLGMRIGKKELGDILYGPDAPEEIKRVGTDKQTGQFNPVQAKQAIDAQLKKGTAEQKDNINSYINQLEEQRMSEKFTSLLANSINYPRWFLEKQNADNSQMAKISMVREVYSSIPDSAIKIDDKEIADYISKHKDDYKQEESRSISYVTFSAAPTSADTQAIKKVILSFKPEFDTTTDVETFLARNGSSNSFTGYTAASQLPAVAKDSIQRLSKNQVFGPYINQGNFELAKMLDTKVLPDSVKCRHILVSTNVEEGGFEDSVAAKKIDSIKNAVTAGASWADMVDKYNPKSDGSRQQKGEMTFSSATIQGEGFAKEFAQFILFDGKPGDKKVVKTSFGYHYIEILSYIKPEEQYKIAYLSEEITPSQTTHDNALNEASQFAGDSRDEKSFDDNYQKQLKPKGIIKAVATEIPPTGADIQGLGSSRSFVKDIYAAKRGEVLKPEQIENNYVVAVVTDVYDEGTKGVSKARIEVEPLLRNKKKAEMLKQKIGKVTTLEAAAASLGGKKIESVDSLRLNSKSGSSTLGYEPKVSGAVFNPANKGKIIPEALEGVSGVYVIRVDSISATAITSGDIAEQRKAFYEQAKQNVSNPQSPANPLAPLREAATIKDKRADKY